MGLGCTALLGIPSPDLLAVQPASQSRTKKMSGIKNNKEQLALIDALVKSGITREYIEEMKAEAQAEQLRLGMSRDEYFAHCLGNLRRRSHLENN